MTYNPNQGQWAPQGAPQGGYYAPSQNGGGGNTVAWVIAAVAVTALLLIGGFVGYTALTSDGSSDADQPPAFEYTEPAQPASAATQTATTVADAPQAPSSQPERQAPATDGYNNYDYNSVTSASFAANVYSAWKDNYAATGNKSATLSVYSPYTGGTYTMRCYPSGSAVRCTGGDNALVSIY